MTTEPPIERVYIYINIKLCDTHVRRQNGSRKKREREWNIIVIVVVAVVVAIAYEAKNVFAQRDIFGVLVFKCPPIYGVPNIYIGEQYTNARTLSPYAGQC